MEKKQVEKLTAQEETSEKIHLGPINIEKASPSERYEDVFTLHKADAIDSFQQNKEGVSFKSKNGIHLKISILENNIFKITYSHDGYFLDDFSYAIDPNYTPSFPNYHIEEFSKHYTIETQALKLTIAKENMLLRFYDLSGNLLNEDFQGFEAKSSIMEGLQKVSMSKKIEEDEQFYGLGDKTQSNDLRNFTFENWNSDSFHYGTDTDPLYRSIPFFYSIREKLSYGIFFDNTYKTHFDFGSKDKKELTFSSEGGDLNYYFIGGQHPTEIAMSYTQLTGTPELPPMWGLGFHQCRWSYYPESRVRKLAATFRLQKIPCDALYLDIDYMENYKCFTWDKKHFPQPTQMLKDLKADGFHTVVMIDPGIKVANDYDIYLSGMQEDIFCKRPDGRTMQGPVWPPNCVFPDYTNPKARAWWGPLYKQLYEENGVSGFWNDMNEPAVFAVNSKTFPLDIRHDFEGQGADHKRAHNIYGMQMTRATYEGLKKLKTHKRPLVIGRATYSGGQRFASTWTGDNVSTWEHLKIANIQCLRLSISGFSYVGTDIGGFVGDPDGELMTRWLQLGIFHPLYRVHSMGNNVDGAAAVDESVAALDRDNKLNQEPWANGEPYTSYSRKAIELRYQLLAYLYTAFKEYTEKGFPILRPLGFAFPTINEANRDEFMWGDKILVAPILEKGIKKQEVLLPNGEWYDFNNNLLHAGGKTIRKNVDLTSIPLFVKSGTVLPIYPIRQYTGQRIKQGVSLKIFYKLGTAESRMYEDEGEGYGYENEVYLDRKFSLVGTVDSLLVQQNQTGTYQSDYSDFTLQIIGLPFEVSKVEIDGHEQVSAILKKGIHYISLTVNQRFKRLFIH